MAIIVSDTSPFRALDHLGRLDLLGLLYGEVFVPPAVVTELCDSESVLPSLDVRTIPAVHVRAPQDRSVVNRFLMELDEGEAEAIALALELEASTILIDEAHGRAVARREGLTPVGVLGMLVRAKASGYVMAVRPLIDRLQTELSFRISDAIKKETLRLAGE